MKKLLLLAFLCCLSCAKEKKIYENPIEFALAADTDKIQNVVDNLEAHEVQIIVTDADGKDYNFQTDNNEYFYPASSVKFPIALAALEKANRIAAITSNTPFYIENDTVQTTIYEEVRKIFAVSDNDAYNRLFEFLGKDAIDRKLKSKGLYPVRISHRLSTDNADDVASKPVKFIKDGVIVHYQPSLKNRPIRRLKLQKVKKGKGYYKDGKLINQPMDFTKKNYLPISTLHKMMKRLYYPEKFNPITRFILSQEDREFLKEVMLLPPRKQGFDDPEYYDSYVKFFMYGDTKEPMPDHIKIYNKVGYAYGYLTDCAHIVDTKNDIKFTITATIHVNKNKIFNDDTYEYDKIGIPFLAELGRQVHAFYLQKKTEKQS